MHPTVYLDTSVVCYLTDPPSSNPITRACQQLTQLWWHTHCDPSATFVSNYVINEIKSGDPLRAMQRLRSVKHLVEHPENERLESMSELLVLGGGLNGKGGGAARHIASATFNKCEILLTWNCVDIANAQKLRLLRLLINDGEFVLPELVTPFELMENCYETEWHRNSR
jgi:hypothetical protein